MLLYDSNMNFTKTKMILSYMSDGHIEKVLAYIEQVYKNTQQTNKINYLTLTY